MVRRFSGGCPGSCSLQDHHIVCFILGTPMHWLVSYTHLTLICQSGMGREESGIGLIFLGNSVLPGSPKQRSVQSVSCETLLCFFETSALPGETRLLKSGTFFLGREC